MGDDHYRTLTGQSEARIKIERSEFIGIALPTEGDAAFAASLAAIEKRFFDATHHCWAFRLFDGGAARSRSSDAGEPSGTAGKPILNAIESASIFDAGVVVVRYYGGVKLGTGGLTRAYRQAAQEALAAAPSEIRYLYDRVEIGVPFAALSTVYRLVSPPDRILVEERFGESNVFAFDVRRSLTESFLRELTEKRLRARRV